MSIRTSAFATGVAILAAMNTGGATISGIEAASSSQSQAQPRDLKPGEPRPASARELQLKAATASDPSNVANWIELARLQEDRGANAEAERTLQSAAAGGERAVLSALAAFYNRAGEFEKTMGVLENIAQRHPTDLQAHQLVAVYYYDKASKDQRLSAEDRLRYADAGIAAEDRVLAQNPESVDALVYKGLLLRIKANLDAANRDALIAEANMLRDRGLELQKARAATTSSTSSSLAPGAPQPPPPPGPPTPPPLVDGLQPVRVGGNIKAPTKLHDVRPEYPADALNAGVSGMVIVEATIDTQGNIHTTKVLRSIPMLDAAAVEAVKGWKFTPTHLNGSPVPVIMTVTVNFTRQ